MEHPRGLSCSPQGPDPALPLTPKAVSEQVCPAGPQQGATFPKAGSEILLCDRLLLPKQNKQTQTNKNTQTCFFLSAF